MSRVEVPLLPVFFVYTAIFVGYSVLTPSTHDHVEYLKHWQTVLAGLDPWSEVLSETPNAYGPGHASLAVAYAISPALPRALYGLAAVLIGYTLMNRLAVDGKVTLAPITIATALAFALHPLVLDTVFHLHLNDITCAVLILGAYLARERGLFVWAGVAIGLAALIKFYPIIFAPFLMMREGRELVLRLGLAAAATFILGMALSYLAWGDGVFEPLLYAAGREAKMFSIYRFFEAYPALVGGEASLQTLIDTNKYVLLTMAVGVFAYLFAVDAPWKQASVVGVLAILMAYKTGHMQFLIPWLVGYGLVLTDRDNPVSRKLALCFAPLVVWMGAMQIVYQATGWMLGEWQYLRGLLSLPTFILQFGGLAVALRLLWRAPSLRPKLAF